MAVAETSRVMTSGMRPGSFWPAVWSVVVMVPSGESRVRVRESGVEARLTADRSGRSGRRDGVSGVVDLVREGIAGGML
jgi:hypothetical protein